MCSEDIKVQRVRGLRGQSHWGQDIRVKGTGVKIGGGSSIGSVVVMSVQVKKWIKVKMERVQKGSSRRKVKVIRCQDQKVSSIKAAKVKRGPKSEGVKVGKGPGWTGMIDLY